jgi:hypothetical protein
LAIIQREAPSKHHYSSQKITSNHIVFSSSSKFLIIWIQTLLKGSPTIQRILNEFASCGD